MTTTLFTDGWTFYRGSDVAGTPVRLPHDAMIGEPRIAEGGTGNHGGFFPGAVYAYRKRWTAPDSFDDLSYRLTFEGVYGATTVKVNGREVARNDSPYREFHVALEGVAPGDTPLIEVEVDNRATPNSRWYTGSGMYRPVWLEEVGNAEIAPDGLQIVTRALRPVAGRVDATVEVSVYTAGVISAGAAVVVEFEYDGQPVARRKAEVTGTAVTVEVPIPAARLWSAESPDLYDVSVSLLVDGHVVDERLVRTGVRTVEVDARRGLRVNGREVLLRGTAVHHDNGPLGAATLAAAERRRANLLKQAGYNAVRSAHNPLSRAFLDACDEIGLYVMDELTDVWFAPKTLHDGAARFLDEWRDDVSAMVAKDRNRPSVIMYSIGNEIAEASSARGVELARQMTAFLTGIDPTRPTTIAVNPLLAMMAARSNSSPDDGPKAPAERTSATSTVANLLTAKLGRMMVMASALPAADKATRDIFAAVDIAGYNYGYANYGKARRRYPERVIVGTESMHGDLPAIWKRVTSVPGVIGDFSWTGWDYLGEVGLGYWSYGAEAGGIAKPFPGTFAGCGAFDITGAPGATLLLAQAVWGITGMPGIAVRPLDRAGRRPNKTPWLPTDAVQSWSWRGNEGVAQIEVYSADDQIELLLNGRSLGRRAAGPKRGYVARFRVPFEPGELVAVAYRNGEETGRSSLRSAGQPRLRLRAETPELHGPDDLAYVWIELADETGTVDAASDDRVTVSVSGPGILAGLGSAAPSTLESFVDDVRSTHRGRAIAIVRGTEEHGEVTVRVTSERHGEASLSLSSTGGAEAGVAAATRKERS
ncbi:MAG: glycoside hydrolase family 2 TIM barrel-domain containing protein [Microbacterium sp.]